MIKTLNGKWRFRRADTDTYYPATVPGCNFTDLMDEGIIPDPLTVSMRETAPLWVKRTGFTKETSP